MDSLRGGILAHGIFWLIIYVDHKQEIRQSIRERKLTLKISQGRLAELAGVAAHTILNLEMGKGNCTVEILLKVAQMLGYASRVGT